MKLRNTLALFATLAVTLVTAGPAFAICAQAKPPNKFLGEPPHPYVVKTADPIGIFSKCNADMATVQGTWTLYGCYRQTSKTGFTIYVTSDAKGPMRDCIIEHEKAHLWGWRHGNRVKHPTQQLDPFYKGPHPIK